MNAEMPRTVSEATLKRLPLYHRFLKELLQREQEAVSCTDIGEELKLDPTQVRKDLEAAGISGHSISRPVSSEARLISSQPPANASMNTPPRAGSWSFI